MNLIAWILIISLFLHNLWLIRKGNKKNDTINELQICIASASIKELYIDLITEAVPYDSSKVTDYLISLNKYCQPLSEKQKKTALERIFTHYESEVGEKMDLHIRVVKRIEQAVLSSNSSF